MSGNLETWNSVPVGSTLHLRVGPDGEYAASARVSPTDDSLGHDDLVPGPAPITISGPTTVLVTIIWQGSESECDIRAQVVDPNGNIVPTGGGNASYDYHVSGSAGDPPVGSTLLLTV